MTEKLPLSLLANPLTLWTDLGWRALDATVASSQDLGEGVDRLARAAANASAGTVAEAVLPAAASPASATAPAPGLALAATLQRSALDLMTRGWLQWVSACMAPLAAGWTFTSLAPGARFAGALQPGAADTPAAPPQPVTHRQRRTAHAPKPAGALEHAFARDEPKRSRRRPAGKAKAR